MKRLSQKLLSLLLCVVLVLGILPSGVQAEEFAQPEPAERVSVDTETPNVPEQFPDAQETPAVTESPMPPATPNPAPTESLPAETKPAEEQELASEVMAPDGVTKDLISLTLSPQEEFAYSLPSEGNDWFINLTATYGDALEGNQQITFKVYEGESVDESELLGTYEGTARSGNTSTKIEVPATIRPTDSNGKIYVTAQLGEGTPASAVYQLCGTLDVTPASKSVDSIQKLFLNNVDSFQLAYSGNPEPDSVKWDGGYQGASNAAWVDQTGKVTFTRFYSSEVTYYFTADAGDGRVARCTASFVKGADAIKLNDSSARVGLGDESVLALTLSTPNMRVSVTNPQITVSDPAVVKAEVVTTKIGIFDDVISGVKLTGLASGVATVSLSVGRGDTLRTSICSVTVTGDEVVESVAVTPETATLATRDTLKLAALCQPETATVRLDYRSSAPGVASVSENGVVTAKAAGSATITVRATDYKGTSVEDACVVTVTDESYHVTVYAPTYANVAFYPSTGYDSEDRDTFVHDSAISAVTEGTADGYNIYTMNLAEGKYSFRATANEGGADLGGMSFTVPAPVSGGGVSSHEDTKIYLRQADFWITNKYENAKATADDFSVEVVSGNGVATMGTAYTGADGFVRYPTLLYVAGNAYLYNYMLTPSADYTLAYKVGSVMVGNQAWSPAVGIQNCSAALPNTIQYTINAPEGAEVAVFQQIKNFNTVAYTTRTMAEKDDGTVDYIYQMPLGGRNYNYRVSMEGKVTRAAYMTLSQNVAVTVRFAEQENPKNQSMNNTSFSQEATTLLNLNERNKLSLNVGGTYKVRAYRGAWQIVNTLVDNIMIEPDFHYNILSGADVIDLKQVDGGNAKGNWANITAQKEGVAIVEVSFDAISVDGVSGMGVVSDNGYDVSGRFGASDSRRTGVFVVAVGGNDTDLGGISWDAEFNTFYFFEEKGAYTMNPVGSDVSVQVASVWEGTLGAWQDGKKVPGGFELPIENGNNVIKIVSDGRIDYRIVRGSRLVPTVASPNADGKFYPGDTASVTFKGLYAPMPKFSGIYNPGFPATMRMSYTAAGKELMSGGVQYSIIDPASHKLSFTVQADADNAQVMTLTDGKIGGTSMGSEYGKHRTLTDMGVSANFNAAELRLPNSSLPNIVIPVTSMVTEVTFAGLPVGAKIALTKDGVTIAPKEENGVVYALDGGSYSYVITCTEYKTVFGALTRGGDSKSETITIAMERASAYWNGKEATEPNKSGDVYQITNGAELNWYTNEIKTTTTLNAVLINDVYLYEQPWSSIGYTKGKPFSGTFDGAGHAVEGISATKSTAGLGLFGFVSGTVKNLTVDGRISSTNGGQVGGLVGSLLSGGTVESCHNRAAVSGTKNGVGGLVGQNEGTVRNSSNHGTVNSAGGQYAGGVAGLSNGTVTGCYNTAAITSTADGVGGVIGGNTGKTTVENCYNIGMVNGTGQAAGGISGSLRGGESSVSNCYSAGAVSGRNAGNTGGIAGISDAVTPKNCHYLEGASPKGIGTLLTGAEDQSVAQTATALRNLSVTLGGAYQSDLSGTNGYYPILKWQSGSETEKPGSGGTTTPGAAGPDKTHTKSYYKTTGLDFDMGGQTTAGYVTISFEDYGTRMRGESGITYQTPLGVLIESTEVPYTTGDSIADVTLRLLDALDIGYGHTGSTSAGFYLANIKDFYLSDGYLMNSFGEFDSGAGSGWMITMNNWFVNRSTCEFDVEDGDIIKWQNTCQVGADIGCDWSNGSAEITGLNFKKNYGTLSPAFSKDADAYIYTIPSSVKTIQLEGLQENYWAILTYTSNGISYKPMREIPVENGTVIELYCSFAEFAGDVPTDEDALTITIQVKGEPSVSPTPPTGNTNTQPEVTVKPEATVDKNGEAKASVSDKEITSAIEDAKKNHATGIVIEPVVTGSAGKVSVELSKTSVASIAKDAGVTLTVKTFIADVAIPSSALSELGRAEGKTVSVSAEALKNQEGKANGQIKVELAVDGKPVDSVKGGLTVSLPAQKSTSGTVLMIITDEGAQIVRKSAVSGKNLAALLDGSATVIVKDNSKSFADVEVNYWGADAVNFAASHELFQGTGVNIFDPAGTMTRSMLVTVLHRLENEVKSDVTSSFADVASGAWYGDAVAWANANGIVTGTGAGFDPDGGISREQLATMLCRYAKAAGMDTTAGGNTMKEFADANEVSGWAADAVKWAVGSGLIGGKSGGVLDPAGTATRAEVATMLQRFILLIVKSS